jgi:DNA-binding NarL/FixJ family response regulator
MVEAIDGVLGGEKIYPPSIAYLLYQHLAQRSRACERRNRLDALALTPREFEVLSLIADRSSNEAIALRLGISIHTVKNHVHNILEKLEADNRNAAAELALQKGWLEQPEMGQGTDR